ncbi:ATPase inhibitor protein trans-spliced [Fasciola gigantica]|uniref:ATPase inhibitor protein trans-spliced n=1 Tax=Fasciola gigantica TaxID=46835 RepID=A0A504Y7Z4_FASGI|nr:ATPase inhibitor protein trans-spliced [Fasciola gigantica]
MFGGSEPGAGAGKGGGAGGSIREAGGSLARRGAALEDEYFRRQEAEQLKELRKRARINPKPLRAPVLKNTLMRIRQTRMLVLATTIIGQALVNVTPSRW